ncbi:MAG: FAD-binding protein [Pigmentiphaga sp.]|uniref:FAD-binding protein n=1 Tax=Pigmentiphaga sp. TaxID=1977564 RepID=UPI0029A4C4CB|nr:FAD-binding protein [Pigmentiphaga sp.]MDX3904749.1 FAD-binding protein [Pigmentiphaga sp.]
MKPGRRAFLLPGMLSDAPWPAFCQRLARVAKGPVHDETAEPGVPGRARLVVGREEDVYHAAALCRELGVLLVQPGAREAALPVDRDWLRLDLSRLAAIEMLDERRGLAVVQAGCPMGELHDRLAGTSWRWHAADDQELVGEWLMRTRGWLPGRCADSGLDAALVLLADGSFEQFGPFGADSTQPLRSAAGSRLVSELFQLAGDPAMASMLEEPAWPAGYRLDALSPRVGPEGVTPVPNPAHFLLGSEGTLAWPARFRLRLRDAGIAPPALSLAAREAGGAGRETPADRLDAFVKATFDAGGVFPSSVV